MNILYHSTFGQYISSIKKEGLIPNKNETWGKCDYGIYLANDEELARSYTETTDNPDIPEEYFDDIVVLKINISLLQKHLLADDPHIIQYSNPNKYRNYLYKGNIPIEAIINLRQF